MSEELIKVEVTEEGGIKDGREVRHHGEVHVAKTQEELVKYSAWVENGWAINLLTGEQNERNLTPKRVDPDPVVSASS